MIRKKRWKDLTRSQQVSVAVMGMIQLLLLAAALWDIRQRPAEKINGNKKLWTAAVFINFFGPIAYFLFGKKGEVKL
jgi:hypothetical protein